MPITARASSTDLPFTAALMSEDDAWEMEQPCPVSLMSVTTPKNEINEIGLIAMGLEDAFESLSIYVDEKFDNEMHEMKKVEITKL